MPVGILADQIDFDGWRRAAKMFRAQGVPPAEARFRVEGEAQDGLFDADPPSSSPPGDDFTVPRAFVELAGSVILHRAPDRFDLMYRLLWRLRDTPNLMCVTTDVDVARAADMAKNVSRASHKMKAFVRFRHVQAGQDEHWVAWFEPAHRVLARTAPFFARRFSNMNWSILTPDGAAHWDGQALGFGPPASRDMAPDGDEVEEVWRTYYASTFNPARLKTRTMQGEMPKRYWRNLPEASLIPELVARAEVRAETMVQAAPSRPNPRLAKTARAAVQAPAPDRPPGDLATLARGIEACRRCSLWRDATQGVAGQGPFARLMIVGEQPGDQEDLAGRPFVGPAGQMLDRALDEAGVDRAEVYLTNAVKHFKHEPRGKRRLHRTPDAGEVTACRWWLDHERRLVRPRLVLALGATAAQAVLGRKVAVTRERGRPIALDDGAMALVTVHPAYLLRLPDAQARARERAAFVADLRQAGDLV